ncbi:MAG: DegT/DnrJ/EryC1/StrS family aminotransferase [Acidobacteria bacterium]|nr:DegT/DnrJ/EryC1/StrS family aminotransferase [Acidobacteriota bacterium]MBV9184536.1 DegT/DnrJ/EryC1/StrS family aminotransferase [Acidobacteriota bacterium]
MSIPLLDLKQQYATIRDEVLRVTNEVYESQYFILGPRVDAFERDFAAYCQSKYAVGLSSGTDALLIALMVLGVGPGDEVIVPAYSFFATAGVVDRLGATPVFVDIDLADYNIDPKQIESRITSCTKAIMPVHLYGQCAAMDEINRIATKHNLAVVEDAAQAVGAEYDGRRAGVLGTIGAFSFFPSKNLGAFGDAGAVTCEDHETYEKLIDFRVHGMRPKYYHRYVGGNFRIDALQAAILHIKLPHLDAWSEGRRRNAAIYAELFAETNFGDRIVLPRELPKRRHIYNQYIVRFADNAARDRVLNHLKSAGIGCEVYYPLTLPQQECFTDVPSASEHFPHSDAAAATTLAIPIFPELTKDQMAEVVREIGNGLG